MRRFTPLALCAMFVGSLCASPAISHAAFIDFHGDTTNSTGTGFGHVLGVLTLQDASPHADNLEAGSVVWNGSTDVYGTIGGGIDTKTQLSQTRTVSELSAEGINE